jgi:hypothetical protein
VDEKKVKEAIEFLQRKIRTLDAQKEYDEYCNPVHNETLDLAIGLYETAIEALEKQLPKKVKMRTEYRDLNDELICYKGFCPSCGNVVDSYRNKSCNHCTQMLDWSEAH